MTYTASPKDLQATAKDLIDVISKKKVKIDIAQTYALKDAVQAHRDLEVSQNDWPNHSFALS